MSLASNRSLGDNRRRLVGRAGINPCPSSTLEALEASKDATLSSAEGDGEGFDVVEVE